MVRRPAFETLSDVVDTCESHGGSVQSAEATVDGDTVTVQLVVDHALTTESAGVFTPEAAAVTGDGDLQVEFRSPSLASLLPSSAPITAERTETVAVTDEGCLRCTHELTLCPEGEAEPTADDSTRAAADPATNASDAPTDDLAATRDDSLPPYDDTEYLRALYESCDTFEEMAREIEMDVVAETVRRYMVDAGIHTPNSYDVQDTVDEDAPNDTDAAATASDPEDVDDAMAEQLVADGIGLPESIGVTDLVDAVVEAKTVYEVRRDLGLDQERTRELLSQFGLLGQVMHRVSDDHQGLSRDEVVRQVRRHGTV